MDFPAASAGPEARNRTHNPSYRPVIPAKPVSTDRVRGQLNDGSRPAPGRRL